MQKSVLVCLCAIAAITWRSAANAQFFYETPGPICCPQLTGPADPHNDYVLVQRIIPGAVGDSGRGWIPLSQFGQQINDNLSARIDSAVSRLQAVDRQITRAFDLIAVSGAMKDAIPNAGDRFAIRLNAAVFEGHGAAAIGFSYNLTDTTRASINYGQGRTQGMVSGGLNFSFR